MTKFVLGPTSLARLGESIGLGCQRCAFLEPCGGTFAGWDCFANCCGDPPNCTIACPHSPNFVNVLQDAGGLETNGKSGIRQRADELPSYIPLVHSRFSRSRRLPSEHVALTTFDVAWPGCQRMFQSSNELREHFRLLPNAQLILVSVAKDNRLERYWKYEESRQVAQYLAGLGIAHVTAPNYSFPLHVPRTEHLVNKMRSIRSAERLSAAGLSVIPHLNAFNQRDWDNWRDFLRDHPHIKMVAQEFQTGLASRKKASWHVWQMCNIEQFLGRGLHIVAVGGRRHLRLLVGLSAVTVIDSVPFLRACKRRLLDRTQGKWVIRKTPPGKPIDSLHENNLVAYRGHVEATIGALLRAGPLVPALEPVVEILETTFAPTNSGGELQMSLWPKNDASFARSAG
jgi:hypothetical protein